MKRALLLAALLGCAGGFDVEHDECSRTLQGCAPAVVVDLHLAESVKGECPESLTLADDVPQLPDAAECTAVPRYADCVVEPEWWCRSRVYIGLGTTAAREVRTCDGFVVRECRYSVPADDDPVADALALWTDAIGVEAADLPPFRLEMRGTVECNGRGNYNGCTYPAGEDGVRVIALRSALSGRRRRNVLAHELGHLMGARAHLASGLMSPSALGGDEVDEGAASAVCAAGVVQCR